MTTESPNLADTLPEPPDGSRLMLIERDGFVRPIWRDDAGARGQSASEGERWFDDCTDPADWREILRYATKVYAVASEPMTAGPSCKAVDRIVRWDEVQEGDLALAEGVMMQVEQIYPPDEERVVFRWSDGFTREHRLADLTAVTRYVETTDPDDKEA